MMAPILVQAVMKLSLVCMVAVTVLCSELTPQSAVLELQGRAAGSSR